MIDRDQWHRDREREAVSRQLVLLGAVLASREIRESLSGIEGFSSQLSAALDDVTRGEKGMPNLMAALDGIGVHDWSPSEGNPLKLIEEHVRLDGEITWEMAGVASLASKVMLSRGGSVEQKRQAVHSLQGHLAELVGEEERIRILSETYARKAGDEADSIAAHEQEAAGRDGRAGASRSADPLAV